MPSPAENALPTSDRRHTHTRGGSTGDGSGDLRTHAGGRDRHLPPRTRRILHVDVDAFLASVEQAVHPELRGLPVVIGGLPTDRNLVMSCSYPARAYGVKPGMLLPEAYRRCPQAIFRRGDSQAAKRLREALAHVLMRATPIVEVASIDDFFADLTGTTRAQGDAFAVAERARAAIHSELSLPVTIGIGTNRTLARLAGKLAKPGGIAEILPGHERGFLHTLPLTHLPGAGHVMGRMLERFGLTRVGELTLVPREVLFASFGALGLVIHERAHGRDPTPVEATFTQDASGSWIERMPRSIRRDSTFEPEEGRREIVEAMFAYLVERATHVLRKHKAVVKSVAVRILYVDTRPKPTDRPRAENVEHEKRARLSSPTDSTDAILQRVLATWHELPRRRALVKRVGITLVDLTRGQGWQRTLFDDVPTAAPADTADPNRASRADRERRLDRALDELRARHGFGRILRGSSVPLKGDHELTPDGFRLRTPSLNQ
ncbi:MAG: DNA polymerase IV [Planctomycetes bacterium]|nr:DNA polymerase IV [Planctomycetota bacterium]